MIMLGLRRKPFYEDSVGFTVCQRFMIPMFDLVHALVPAADWRRITSQTDEPFPLFPPKFVLERYGIPDTRR